MIFNVAQNLINSGTDCLACPVFDKLFQVVSAVGTSAYTYLVGACFALFCILFAFYVINTVWNNMKNNSTDTWHTKSVQKVIINSLFALVLLATGVAFPRLITQITAEPVAHITLTYTQALTQQDPYATEQNVRYTPEPMRENEMFSPDLRDAVIDVMKGTVYVLQGFILGATGVIDASIEWSAFTGLGIFVKHVILFFVGLALLWSFAKLFIKYCFYFADFIVAMAFFALLFPISMILLPFKGAEGVPGWLGGLGNSIGKKQIKNLINSIVALGAVVLSYTIITNVLVGFLVPDAPNNPESFINTADLFSQDFGINGFESMNLMSCTALTFVLAYLEQQVPKVSQMILSAFNVQPENKLGEQMGDMAIKLASNAINVVKNTGKTIMGKNGTPSAPAPKAK